MFRFFLVFLRKCNENRKITFSFKCYRKVQQLLMPKTYKLNTFPLTLITPLTSFFIIVVMLKSY